MLYIYTDSVYQNQSILHLLKAEKNNLDQQNVNEMSYPTTYN